MIFFVENQLIYEPPEDNYYHLLPFLEASNIYSKLYELNPATLSQIDKIIFTVADKTAIKQYKSGFKCYSGNPRNCPTEKQLIAEILDRFPPLEKLEDVEKSKKIDSLINNAQILFINVEKDLQLLIKDIKEVHENVLCYLPFCKGQSDYLITKFNPGNCKMFTLGFEGKLKAEEKVSFIEPEKYLNVKKSLKELKAIITTREFDPLTARERRYKDILELFEKGFSQKLKYVIANGKIRSHFLGEEIFLAKKAIDKLASGSDRYNYYMPKDLDKIEGKDQSMAVFNFDSINSPEGYNYIYKAAQKISDDSYIILQAIKNVASDYFPNYDEILIPSDIEIKEKLTEIFIYILLERNIYTDMYWRLFALIEGNLIAKILPQFDSLESLFKAMHKFQNVQYIDIIENPNFWLILEDEINLIIHSSRDKSKNEPKPKIIFEHRDDNWIVYGLGSTLTFKYSENRGLLYLAVILKSEKDLTSSQVKEIAYRSIGKKKYLDKIAIDKKSIIDEIKNPVDVLESDRKTISSAISQIKKNSRLKTFIEEHVKFGLTSNSFYSRNKIDVEVIDPNIK